MTETEKQIIKHIDDGANFYISLFGNAEHMIMVDNGFYSYVIPKEGEHGIKFVYDIRITHLPIEQQKEIVAEIKALDMPIWLDLFASDKLHNLFFGKDKVHGQTVFADNDEVYLALSPDEKPNYTASSDKIIKVKTVDEFALWAKITNDLLAGGYPDMHPVYHYPLCQKGAMKCYILYKSSTPAAVATIMDNNGVASLEFVATIPEMRRQGHAKSVCEKAVSDTFTDGAKIITVRAINAAASSLYQSLGFVVYNHIL